MRILLACEFSGIVRNAFTNLGHDAWSCDLLPTESPGQHIQGNVLEIINQNWDIMIGFPPCTYLSYAANSVWNTPGRAEKRDKALHFFMTLASAPIERICIENPMGYAQTEFRKCDQIIHPYYFGDRALKRTCLWLKNLPQLVWHREDDLFGKKTFTDYPIPIYIDKNSNKKRYHTDALSDKHKRSIFWPGIANAMAEQWGSINKITRSLPADHQITPG